MDKYKIVKRVYLDFLTPQDQVTLKCDSGTVEYDGKHTIWYVDDNGKREETINMSGLIDVYVRDGLLVKLPEETSVFERVAKILNDTELPQWEIKDEHRLKDDLGLDSLNIIEFGFEVEAEFDIRIEDHVFDALQLGTVKDIVEYIKKNI